MDPVAHTNLLVKTGGYIMAPSFGPHFLILNAQKRVPVEVANRTSAEITRVLQIPVRLKDDNKERDPMETVNDVLKDKSVAVLLMISDTPKYPPILVAPESRWVIINTAALAAGSQTNDVLASRLNKEIWRAFGMVLGGGNSSFSDCLMQPIFKTEQLDELKGKAISPDPLQRMWRTIEKLGIQPQRLTTYRKACEEGWAPMPTNSYQNVIWEELKTSKKTSR